MRRSCPSRPRLAGAPTAPLAAVAVATVLAAACYRVDVPRCGAVCGEGDACPSGMECLADGFCHSPGEPPACGGAPDARPGAPDAALSPDALGGPPDAFTGWIGAPCAVSPGTLATDFDDLPVGLQKNEVGGGLVEVSGGNLLLKVPLTAVESYAGVGATAATPLAGRRFYIHLGEVLSPTVTNTELYFGVATDLTDFTNFDDQLMLSVTDGVLRAWLTTAGGVNQFDAARTLVPGGQDAWWQVRHTGSTVFLETSPDGTHWTQLASGDAPAWLATGRLVIQAHGFAPPSDPGTASIDLLGDCAVP